MMGPMHHIYAWATHHHAQGLRSVMSFYCHSTQAVQLTMLVQRSLETLENPRGFGGSILGVPCGDRGIS
jgi:hypothetical protein